MRYYVDTEFKWFPDLGTIEPISVGMVAEDGREFYWVTRLEEASRHATDWVCTNVLAAKIIRAQDATYKGDAVGSAIREFVGDDRPEFWGDYAAFDYVVLSMVMGGFGDWPKGWPMHINDMRSFLGSGTPELAGFEVASATPHNALADARAIRNWMHAAYPPEVTNGQAE